jgi:hypothetical protein
MIKKTLLAVSALLIFTSSSQSKEIEIEGEMICTVKSNYVVEINEGKTKTYSGVEGSFSKGDDLIFKFFTDEFGIAYIKLLYKDKVLGSNSIYSKAQYFGEKVELTDNGFRYGTVGTRRYINSFSGNYIAFNLYPLSGGREFRIERYYKGDWSGIISGRFFPAKGGLGEKVATLDCRQSSDRVDDFVEYVRGLVENE